MGGFPVHYVANYMEQILENKIGKIVPFGVVSEAMNEPVGPVDNVIEKDWTILHYFISFGSAKDVSNLLCRDDFQPCLKTGSFLPLLFLPECPESAQKKNLIKKYLLKKNFDISDLQESNSLSISLKNWLESSISLSRTSSQDSHLCSNLTATVTDGASERSSEKSYKIVTHDDFFIADETAGTENDSILSSKSDINQTVKQASADTIEPVSNGTPPFDTLDSYKTINSSDSPSNSIITIQSNLTTVTNLTNREKHSSKSFQKFRRFITKPASKAMNKIRETVEMISGFGEEDNTEYLPIKLKNQTEFDQNNNPIQKLNMLKKSKTVSFQSPIVQDNETSTDNLYTKEQASQCDLELVKRRKRKNKKKKKRPASVPNPCQFEDIGNLQTASTEDPIDTVVEARQKMMLFHDYLSTGRMINMIPKGSLAVLSKYTTAAIHLDILLDLIVSDFRAESQ